MRGKQTGIAVSPIERSELPADSLLHRYRDQGAYTDCYAVATEAPIAAADFIEAFYTTRLFKLERFALQLFASLPSTDEQAKQLAKGRVETFAAWEVEDRNHAQLLLTDLRGRTRSWLMAERVGSGGRLYFGSAVIPTDSKSGSPKMGGLFRALLGFHKVYSRLLLRAAVGRLNARRSSS